MDVLSKAMYHFANWRWSRMRAKATAMGADGMVASTTIKRLEWNQHLLEFIAIGTVLFTAKAARASEPMMKGPFTSDLSGQDFWSLLHSGTVRWKW